MARRRLPQTAPPPGDGAGTDDVWAGRSAHLRDRELRRRRGSAGGAEHALARSHRRQRAVLHRHRRRRAAGVANHRLLRPRPHFETSSAALPAGGSTSASWSRARKSTGRSFDLDLDVNVALIEAELVDQLCGHFLVDLEVSAEIDLETWRTRPAYKRMGQYATELILPPAESEPPATGLAPGPGRWASDTRPGSGRSGRRTGGAGGRR